MARTTGRFLIALLALLPLAGQADEDQVEQELLTQIYADGGHTLYCRQAFERGGRVKLDFIYRERQMMDHFGCITTRQCLGKPGFREAFHDLHNVYPVLRQAELDRRRTLFGDLPENVSVASEECPYQLSFQTFTPPPHARGNVARAMLYMHAEHDLPLIGPLEMYQRWSRLDPPDEEEAARNDAIGRLKNRRNPYIDDPEQVEALQDRSRTNLQFK